MSSSKEDYENLITTMGIIFSTAAFLTLIFFVLFYGVAQYEAGALNNWF